MDRSRYISICSAAVAIVAIVSCARQVVPGRARPISERAPVRRYDLVRRGYDHNGFVLNPQLGWHFNKEHQCPNSDTVSDPTTCSWRFSEDRAPTGMTCNTLVVDPDFSDQWSTFMFGITCSDSPLLYTGHINWGDSYRGAVTYEGWMTWDEYSSSDNDYNFVLETDLQHAPFPESVIGVEIDEREIDDFSTGWFRELKKTALSKDSEATKKFVGPRREVVLTGLLGIDAEHMSARVYNLEIHPVYAMAIRVSDENADTDVWALFARDAGNEGFCSHRDRAHLLQWPNQRYQVELPIRCGKAKIEATSSFCSHGNGVPEVSLTVDPGRRVSLASIVLPHGAVVEGELRFKCSGSAIERAVETAAPPLKGAPVDRKFRETPKRHDQLQRELAELCREDPDECELYRASILDKGKCGEVRTNPAQIASIVPPASEPVTCSSGLPPPFDPDKVAGLVASTKPEPDSTTSRPPTKPLPEQDYCDKRAKKNKTAAAICYTLRQARQ